MDDPKIGYKELYLIVISIIHGSLFFIFLDKLNEGYKDFNFLNISFYIFIFCVFLRIFQTQVLAAIRYENKWKLKIFDFVVIFVIGAFEYFLMQLLDNSNFNKEKIYVYFICFGIVGIIGYVFTYLSIKKSNEDNIKEKNIQLINILALIIIISIFLVAFFSESNISKILANIFCSIIFVFNIYSSLKMSNALN